MLLLYHYVSATTSSRWHIWVECIRAWPEICTWVVNWLGHRFGGVRISHGVGQTFKVQIVIEGVSSVLRWLIGDILFFSNLSQSINNFTIHWFLKINPSSHFRINHFQIFICLQHKLLAKHSSQLLSDLHEFLNLEFRSNMNYSCKSLRHIRWSSKLLKIIKPALNLVTHSKSNIITRNKPLIIYQ